MNLHRITEPTEKIIPEEAEAIGINDKFLSTEKELIIPVIEEFLTVEKEIIQTGKISIRKTVQSEIARIDLPLVNETYHIERVPVDKGLLEARPSIIESDGKMIIPVVKEVAVTVIKYKVVEEIHVIRNHTIVPHQQEITLLKDKVEIKRSQPDKK